MFGRQEMFWDGLLALGQRGANGTVVLLSKVASPFSPHVRYLVVVLAELMPHAHW
jgi:hypothetical protein